jgi:hypothetical protein
MPDAPSFQNAALTERYLTSVSPEAVFNWFQSTAEKARINGSTLISDSPFDEKLMPQLLTRSEPLIDLAIATYCDNGDVLSLLWNSGDKTTRLAIAHNTFRRGFGGLPTSNFEEICADEEMISAILMNPSMLHGALANFLERTGNFKSLSEDRWLSALRFAMRSPILRKLPKEDRFSDDGFQSYEQRRPFYAVWKLLIDLDNNDRNAAILSDSFMNIAIFMPPSESLTSGHDFTNLLSNLAEFSEKLENTELVYVQRVLEKWSDPKPLDKDEEKWGNSRTFIRQGVAAGAAKQSSHKNLIAFIRDHPDKWVRAGYYHAFPFRDDAAIHAAFDKDEAFFAEHAVYNSALYLTTPAANLFRNVVDRQSGAEWQDFSIDQMRRRIYHNRALHLWNEDPRLYPHPDDELDAIHPPPLNRDKDESASEFIWRRYEDLKTQGDARLSQILRWLDEAPHEPQRTYPLIVRMVHALSRDVQQCLSMLAEDRQTRSSGFSIFGGERRR